MTDGNGWNEYKRDILHRFDEQKDETRKLEQKVDALTEKINRYIISHEVFKKEMKIKSGIWGFVAGSMPFALFLLKELIIKLMAK